MRSPTYYRVRSAVRITFWSSLAVGFGWLATTSISNWDNYICVDIDIIAQPYDSYWSIAETYCDGNMQSAVSDLISAHGSDTVRVGQLIKVRNND